MKDYPYKLYIDSSLLHDETDNFEQFLSYTCGANECCELSAEADKQNSVVYLKERNVAGELIKAFQARYHNNINITYITSEDEVIVKLSN